ncbi:ATP-dependent helicase [Mediterraneibacter sp.]
MEQYIGWEQFEQAFPIQLNEQQKSAIQSIDGPVLLLAVPGSGKTTVLVTRLGYMIYCRGIDPSQILTVTYTVAATKDMSRRFAGYFGEKLADRLEFRTINGLCAKIISYYGRMIGKTPFELVQDEKMTAGMLSMIYQQSEREYATESDLKTVRTLITYIKNMMLTEKEILELEEKAELKISVIYKEYCRQLRAKGLMDYDDQMVYAYTMLRSVPELLKHFQELYPYICVDEAQDTSKIQHAIIALLASGTENLFMVGDEDQSIYGFRAAYPEALLKFEKNYPNAKVLLMEENFRSDARIVLAADRFIQRNTLRHEKHIKATRKPASDIREIALRNRKAQYTYLAKLAEGCTSQTAILYRDNECIIPLVDLLERNGIPYQMRNAELSFFSHRTVLDIINIIKLAQNPMDTEAFLQIYYKIGTYLRKQDAIRIARISEEKGIPVLDVASEDPDLNGHVLGSVRSMRTHLQNILQDSGERAIYRILQFMGYQEYLNRSGLSDSKLEILRILGNRTDSPIELTERLEQLKAMIREKEPDRKCPLILSTIHASKGLEYSSVYLIDVADGILPESIPQNLRHASAEELKAYEEERRLFYVGVTRAKDQLTLFTTNRPSTFCSEFLGKSSIPEESSKNLMPMDSRTSRTFRQTKPYAAVAGIRQTKASEELYSHLKEELGAGVLVEHKKYGEGVVTQLDDRLVHILFRDDTLRMMDLKTLANAGLLKVKK